MLRLITLFFFLIPSFLLSQDLNPVSWSFDVEKINDQEFELIFKADIQKTWNVYSQYLDDGGPFPTTITYETESIELIGKGVESGSKKEGMDPIFEMNVIKFLDKEPYIIRQRIKKSAASTISGYLTFMTCDDERCLPPTDVDFSIDLNSAKIAAPQNGDGVGIGGQSSIEKKTKVVSTESTVSNSKISWAKIPKDNRPISWTYGLQQINENSYHLIFKAELEKGWNIYSQFIEEGGPEPTSINFEAKEGITIQEQSTEKGYKKEGNDPVFDMFVTKFLDNEPYEITQRIEVTDKTKPLTGYLTYMVCDDEKCLPPTDVEFSFDLLKGIAGSLALQNETSSLTTAGALITGNTIDQIRPKLKDTYAAPMADCGEVATANSSMILMFFFGFLGGLFALLTPCVFPMIPLTVSFFTKDTKRKGWVNGLIYGASIIVIYVTIGLLITALFGTEALNSLSTNWIANTLFFLIFVFFAFSFFGFYEITLPSSWSTKSDSMADQGGLIGIFFMAFTLALVSFSCTGPIIGAALVESASNRVGPFVVMFGFSLALALPFGLFAAFPAWLNSLPSSGGWMNSVKVVLGFIELALAFKFLTVADLTSHWGLLKYETFMGIWILIALAMAAYGMGWIKFPHDSPVNKISTRRWVFSFLSLAFAVYLGSGFMMNPETHTYKSLGLLSGLAPPVSYNLFLAEPEVNKDIKSRYPSFGKCANNIDCFKDYYEGLAYAQAVDKPLLIDHTGHGCVNCRRTEDNIWSDERIRAMLNDDFVLISLYVDDREKLEEVLISKATNKKLRTVGSRWADFEISNFAQFSQPLYVVVTPQEEVVSIPRGYKEGVEEYYSYLKCGLESFNSVSLQ